MAEIRLICGDAAQHSGAADMILTDPPYDMPGGELAAILGRYDAPHLVMLTTMRQLLEFVASAPPWRLAFDFVLDGVAPKKSKSFSVPNYLHQTGVYMTRPGVKSVFDRRRRPRADVFDDTGYWPTILRAPRHAMAEHGMAKSETAITDILGAFAVRSVIDPFAGRGTTALAAVEIGGIDALLIERDQVHAATIRRALAFCCIKMNEA